LLLLKEHPAIPKKSRIKEKKERVRFL